jgi:hypothetical protein
MDNEAVLYASAFSCPYRASHSARSARAYTSITEASTLSLIAVTSWAEAASTQVATSHAQITSSCSPDTSIVS